MASINKVILIGRVGRDPETSIMPSGNAQMTKFPLATSEYYNRNGEWQEITEWHNIVLWNKLSEAYKAAINKGMTLYIEGKIRTNKWQDKDGNNRYRTEIIANQVKILDKAVQNNNQNYSNTYSSNNTMPQNNTNSFTEPAPSVIEDEDIPF